MTTAVIDLDFELLPPVITGLESYNHALILVRLNGQPVSQVRLPVVAGHISSAELLDALLDAADWTFWQRWLHTYLEWDEHHTTDFTPPTATVAVCTRDRPEDVRRCLAALVKLTGEGQEILVVDNCPSTDATRQIVNQYQSIRYVREDRPGLNNARNRALREAKHEVVVFADDDAAPDPGWLEAHLRNYDHPLTLCVTGLTMPLELETEAQECFEYYMSFTRGFQRQVFESTFTQPLSSGRHGVGVNMSFRRRVLEQVGPFDEALDTGTPTRSGGDNEMFSRILAAGYRIVYEPAALSWHCHRRTWPELRKQLYGYGVGSFSALIRNLVVDREVGALGVMWKTMVNRQLSYLPASLLRRPGSIPTDIISVMLGGYAVSPWAYFYSRRLAKNRNH